MSAEARWASLEGELARFAAGGLAVAFSGGVDSTVLVHAALRVLGERACAVLADSPSLPRAELAEARRAADGMGARLVVLATDELERSEYRSNQGARCYWCRHTLFEHMARWAEGAGYGALAYGEIVDDRFDHRPGRRAAEERGIVAPLAAAGWSKADVRAYARAHDLEAADKPASACLASRIPHGTEVTVERLARVERAEQALHALGLRVLRVRDHAPRARVEVGAAERARATDLVTEIEAALVPLGFAAVELATYRTPGASALEDR